MTRNARKLETTSSQFASKISKAECKNYRRISVNFSSVCGRDTVEEEYTGKEEEQSNEHTL